VQRTTILALSILSFGALLPVACTADFNFYQSTSGAGGSSSGSTGSSMHATGSGSGTGTTTSATGTGGGPGGCKVDGDCTPTNACTTATCNTSTGMCAESPSPDGSVPTGFVDMTKDCKTDKCMGGMQQTVADDGDVPDNMNVCVVLTCSMKMVVTTDVMQGMGCGGMQKCDGMGNCVGCNNTNECPDPGSCKSVMCDKMQHKCVISDTNPGSSCNTGGGKVCDGAGNCVGCVVNGDCMSGNCQGNNTCGPAGKGHPCNVNGDCSSMHCVNGVCCENACSGTCHACSDALTGQGDGNCDNVKQGLQPVPANQCTANPPCSDDGKCDGSGACEQFASGTACMPAGCVDGVNGSSEITAIACNGSGMCNQGGVMTSCQHYKCGGTTCKATCASNADCSLTNTCSGDDICCTAPCGPCGTCVGGTVCTPVAVKGATNGCTAIGAGNLCDGNGIAAANCRKNDHKNGAVCTVPADCGMSTNMMCTGNVCN
jgi:hypothetical protein